MGPDGGSTDTLLTCPRDGVATRLQCAECGAPICPACYVRTAVGLKCPTCGAASGPPVPAPAIRSRGPVVAGVAVVVALVLAAGAWAATRGGGGSASGDVADGTARVVVPLTLLGRGELPGGVTWILEARRDGGVCTTLTLSPGPPARERCEADRGTGAIRQTSTSAVRSQSGTVYLTLGQVSDTTERVRVRAEGVAPAEIPTLGGGTGLGVRFFVTHTTANVAETYTALAADGSVLEQMDRPAMPDQPR